MQTVLPRRSREGQLRPADRDANGRGPEGYGMIKGYVKDRYARTLREIGVPAPFDLDEFRGRLERHRGRSIYLVAILSMPEAFSGLWLGTRDGDYVFYPQGVTPLHRAHIVLHEFSHMLLGHGAAAKDRRCIAELLTPGLSSRIVQLALGRNGYTTAEERDAEVMASMLLERATRQVVGRAVSWTRRAHDRQFRGLLNGGNGPCRDLVANRPVAGHGYFPKRGPPGSAATSLVGSMALLSPASAAVVCGVPGRPQIALVLPRGMRFHLRRRLYRRCIEIRDGELMLRPYCDPAAANLAVAEAPQADLGDRALDTMMQVILLTTAIRAKQAGQRARCAAMPGALVAPCVDLDLGTEMEALRRLSLALTRSKTDGLKK